MHRTAGLEDWALAARANPGLDSEPQQVTRDSDSDDSDCRILSNRHRYSLRASGPGPGARAGWLPVGPPGPGLELQVGPRTLSGTQAESPWQCPSSLRLRVAGPGGDSDRPLARPGGRGPGPHDD